MDVSSPAFFSGFGHFLAIFRHFPYIFLVCFSVSLQDCRPSLPLFSCFTSVLGFVVTKHKWPANEVGKGSVLVASEQDLGLRKVALGSRRIRRHGEGDTGRLAPGPDFRDMAFPPTQNCFSEVAHIAVVNGKAISSSDLSRQVALQSRHEARPVPKRLVFGKPRHEINCNAAFSNVIRVDELHEFADQVRIFNLKHRSKFSVSRFSR